MRANWWLAVVALGGAGCSGEDPDDLPFSGTGGTLKIAGCDYSLTTRLDADPPRVSGDKIGADPTPRLVHLGFMDDPRTSMVVQWRTVDDVTTAGTVRYAKGADLAASALDDKVTGVHFAYNSTGADNFRVHQAHLCDLEPGTSYSYQVGSEDHWSPVYTFTTAPDVEANPDAEVIVGYVGDSRGGYDVWAEVVDQLKSRSPDLIMFSGDAVTVGLTQYEWEEFFGVAETLLASVPIISTNGNHEANAVNFYSQFAMPGDQENFGFSYGFARFFVANDSPDDPNALTTTIPTLIDADFTENSTARWKMLMHHRPMWTSGTRHGSNTALQTSWGPVVDEHHLDLVLNGHEHIYEMTKPLVGGVVQTTNANATVYVVAGGAGADLYGFEAQPFSAHAEAAHSAAIIRVRRDQLTLEPFRTDGTAIPMGFTKTKP